MVDINSIDYNSLKPITINPGAEVFGKDFFGRQNEFEYLKKTLTTPRTSLLIPGPRRWGKSSFIKEFGQSHSGGLNFVYMHLQNCQSVQSFFDYFLDIFSFKDHKAFLLNSRRGLQNIINTLRDLFPAFEYEGVKATAGKLKGKDAPALLSELKKIIQRFPKKNTILVMDEISDFLLDLKKRDEEITPEQFLRWLRVLRQEHGVQMILTGSVNVVSTLKELQSQDLVGDIVSFSLPPLPPDESLIFFLSLLKSHDIRITQQETLDFCEGKTSDGVHYFIQLFADEVRKHCHEGDTINNRQQIEGIYESLVQSSITPLSNFNSRLKKYFPPDGERAARKILSTLAYGPKEFDDLFALAGEILNDDKEKFYNLLKRLCYEGYLLDKGGNFSFISALLADYWQKHFYYER